ncbi:amine oxidase [Sphingobacterium siyangense]|uniref:Amine oxidase n=1 Tax=Sphingobacterium siyangense TaxID=459529 RepID=A0A420FV90_9SPHI|nr:NAD(P)/FAD-dependent oxidoreductase [Sphingobacterium siyangense]RKF36851.1 amine oxidase [Sphingobacterium siyangense]
MEKRSNEKIVIVGGGLSGLSLAYFLAKNNIRTSVVEASSRLGGRIQTTRGVLGTPLELGATWFYDMHRQLNALIEELGLIKYPQYAKGISLFQTDPNDPPQRFFVPESEQNYYRLVGGTQTLIDSLVKEIPADTFFLNTKVTHIRNDGAQIQLETSNGIIFEAAKVIICMPPQLISKQIIFTPDLPAAINTLLPAVQTWMGGSVKFTLEYETPFWRKNGFSGMVYSHTGTISEMYDHTNYEEDKFGFTGFLNPGSAYLSSAARKEQVLNELKHLLGVEATTPTAFYDKVWTDEFILDGSPIIARPHQNNGHPLLQQAYMDEKLYFAATETAHDYPGYMEGAVAAAHAVADKLTRNISSKKDL